MGQICISVTVGKYLFQRSLTFLENTAICKQRMPFDIVTIVVTMKSNIGTIAIGLYIRRYLTLLLLLWYLRHLRLRWEDVWCVTQSSTFLLNDTHVQWKHTRILIHTKVFAITSTCLINKFKYTAIEICITTSVASGRAPHVCLLPPQSCETQKRLNRSSRHPLTSSSPPSLPPWTVAQFYQHFRFFPRKKNVLTSRMRSCDGSSLMFLQEFSFTLSSQ